MKETFLIFLRGLLMGIADTIPGVSGGTIAFITGIYQRLINSISKIDLTLLFKPKLFLKKIDFALFIPLGFGIIISFIIFSFLIIFLLESYPAETFSFFFGLILASALYLFTHLKKFNFKKIVLRGLMLLLGILLSYIISGVVAKNINHSLLIIFLSGVIAICAMLLPGISGAFILLLLNQYQFIINSIHTYNLPVILTFGVGAITGLLSFSKLLNYLLKNFKQLTVSFLIGLMIGSLRIPIKIIKENFNNSNIIILIGLAISGFIIVFILEHFFNK